MCEYMYIHMSIRIHLCVYVCIHASVPCAGNQMQHGCWRIIWISSCLLIGLSLFHGRPKSLSRSIGNARALTPNSITTGPTNIICWKSGLIFLHVQKLRLSIFVENLSFFFYLRWESAKSIHKSRIPFINREFRNIFLGDLMLFRAETTLKKHICKKQKLDIEF